MSFAQRPGRRTARATAYPRRRPTGAPRAPSPVAASRTEPGEAGRLLLVDAATRYLSMAALAVEASDSEGRTRHVDRVLRILGALREELALEDPAGDLPCVVLRHVALAATDAGVRQDAESLRAAAEPLRALRRAWAIGLDAPSR